MSLSPLDQLNRFLVQFPDVETLELLIPDQSGILRGKRIERDAFEKAFIDGICLPASVFGLDATGATVEQTGLGFDHGDADRICRPIPETLLPVPWHKNRAQVFITMEEEPGKPFQANPRQVLTEIVDRFRQRGLKPVVAVELEFYLMDNRLDKNGQPQAPVSPLTGQRQESTQVYSIENLDDYKDFIDSVLEYAHIQGVPADGVIAEYAPGQFEVNLHHVDDPVLAADHAIMLKRIIQQAARQEDMRATFMAKPYIGESGSGTHIHCSLIDEHGQNAFAQDESLLKQGVAGLLATLKPAQALLFPNINSFKRLGAETFAPHAPTWGFDNRTVAVRIPAGSEHSLRVEHRVGGADANPYLSVAAVLAGLDLGMQQQLSPPEPIEGNAYEQVTMQLAESARDALEAFRQDEAFHNYFNETFRKVYLAVKEHDLRLFEQQVTPLEYDLLLRL